jgi:hypothetical protein
MNGALVVDGPNWSHAFKSLNVTHTDFGVLSCDLEDALGERLGTPVRFSDRVLVSPEPDPGHPSGEKVRRFHHALRRTGWQVETAPRGCDDALVQSQLDDLAPWHDVLVLGSGDGHMTETLVGLKDRYGVTVVVASTNEGTNSDFGTAWALRQSADVFIELLNLNSVWLSSPTFTSTRFHS